MRINTLSIIATFLFMALPAALSAQATITNVNPNQGPLGGGQSVTITGTGFTGSTAVNFDATAGTSLVVVNDTTITVDTPAGSAGQVDVTVFNPGGDDTATNAYEYVNAATVTNCNPATGPTTGGTTVTITGTNFFGVTSVTFGGTPGTNLSVTNDTSLDVDTPAGTAGQVDVVVTALGGAGTLTNGFEYLALPSITTVNPSAGPLAGGQSVTISGSNFTGATSVTFDGNPGTSLSVVNDSTITVDTPAGSAGQVDVVVTTPAGSDTDSNGYEYVAAPTITVVNPDAGPLAGSQTVTLTGTGFVNVTSVTFDGNPGTSLNVTGPTSLTVDTPAGSAGQVNVVVNAAGGAGTSTNGYEYVAAPTITNINPNTGTTAGGDTVTITGTGFVNVTTVTFDGTPGTNLNVTGPTSLTVDTPAHAAGQVDVVVNAAGGSITSTNGFDYQTPANPPPTFSVMGGGGAITNGGTLNVVQGSAVSAANIQITVNDASTGDSLTLTASITNVGTTGILQSEFEGNSTSPTAIIQNPTTGTFNALVTHAVTLTANDGVNTAVVFNFDIVVGSAPTITVNSPNGGENFTVGGNMTVNWSSSGVTGNVDILLSTNSGTSFLITLATATANDGTQVIVVPNNPSTQCRVQVVDTNTGLTFDSSNADFTIAVPAPAAVAMSAQGNPGSGTANPGASRTALGFRLSETGGASTFTVTSVTARVTLINNTGNAAANAISSISLRRGSTVLGTHTSATWSLGGSVITLNFTGLSSNIAAGANADFTLVISYSAASVPSPNPGYQADIAPADVNGGASVSGAAVTGGTITLVEDLPDDPLDEDDDDDDSCSLSTRGGPAWPMLFIGLLLAAVALQRRRARA